jgi:hypothetical protein
LTVALSDIQVRLTEVVRSVPGADELVLAGGAALVVLGIGDRETNDLDWFADRADVVEALAPRFVQACDAAGLRVTQLISEMGFHRFEVSDGQQATIVDLAWDARMRPAQPSPYGPVLDRDELAADKMLALFGRAAPRDFVDVFRLREHYSRDGLSALAAEKDQGFHAQVFAEMLTRITSYERQDLPVDDATYRRMRREFDSWLLELRPEPSRNPEPPRTPGGTRRPEPPGLELD